MESEEKIILKDENGNEKEYVVLVTFDMNGKSFVIYTDFSTTEEKNLNIFASIYDPTNNDDKVLEITDEEEIKFIEKYIEELENDLKTGIQF